MPISDPRRNVILAASASRRLGRRVFTSATPSTATETKPFSIRENTSPRPYAPTITTR